LYATVFGDWKGKKIYPPKIVAYEGQNKNYVVTWHHWAGKG
jgi:hypothetical protein